MGVPTGYFAPFMIVDTKSRPPSQKQTSDYSSIHKEESRNKITKSKGKDARRRRLRIVTATVAYSIGFKMSLIFTSKTSRNNVSSVVPRSLSFDRGFLTCWSSTFRKITTFHLFLYIAILGRKGGCEVVVDSEATEYFTVCLTVSQSPHCDYLWQCSALKFSRLSIFSRILNITPAKEQGITAGVPNYFENNSNIIYKRISVYDSPTTDLLNHADAIVSFISNALHHGSVLVHCQRGASRSATAVIMFLMNKTNMTLKQALSMCQRRRVEVCPIPAFIEQLEAYEKECRECGYLTAIDDDAEAKVETAAVADATEDSKRPGCPNDDTKVKKRAAIGPSRPPSSTTAGEQRKKKARVIGPSRPP